jgi:lipopolysaccharide/colanic/teichoic acid biosynthesis glycosyltransferase
VDHGLREQLADPDGSHRRAVLAELRRQGGGPAAAAAIPGKAGAGAPVRVERGAALLPRRPGPDHGTRPGRARRPAWYGRLARLADLLGLGVPLGLVLSDHYASGTAAGWAAAGAAGWASVRGLRGRYRADTLGERLELRTALADWAVLLGLAALGCAVLDPAVRFRALLPAFLMGLLVTTAAARTTEAHRRAALRSALSLRRVLLVGEPEAVGRTVDRFASRTDHAYLPVAAVAVGGGPLRIPVADRLPEHDELAGRGGRTGGAGRAGRIGRGGAPLWEAERVLAAARDCTADLVMALPGTRLTGERLRRIAWALDNAGLPLAVVPELVDVATHRVRPESAAGLTVLHLDSSRPPVGDRLVKSVLDRVGSAVGLLLLAPLFLAVAAAIRLTSPGPVFFRQTRHGLGGRPFAMWKFRTMVNEADARKADMESAFAAADGPMFKMRRDPRVTPVGRLLRRTSLDELPQLFNVLRGDMSLVGPRPPLPEEVAVYDAVELRRLAVRPGLTGLWQVSGRSDLSWDETVSLDLRYVDNWSLYGDLTIIFRTFRAVIDGRGAY